MKQTVGVVQEYIFSNRNEELIALLSGSKGLFSHYPKYFKLLFHGITAVHDTTLGLDLLGVVFPRLSRIISGEPIEKAGSPFELNRAAVKYYKPENARLVDMTSRYSHVVLLRRGGFVSGRVLLPHSLSRTLYPCSPTRLF